MATYALVHGGGHGDGATSGWPGSFGFEDHQVFAPTLTGLGERPHLVERRGDLHRYVEDVARCSQFEDLRDVILVGHSYAEW